VPGSLSTLLSSVGVVLSGQEIRHPVAAAPAAASQSPSDLMQGIYEHLFAHSYTHEPYLRIGPIPFQFTNHNLALLISATLVLIAFG